MRKVLLFALVLFLFSPSFAQFVDVSAVSPFYPSVQKLEKSEIIKVPANGKFNGKGDLDKYQLAYILNQILQYSGRGRLIEGRSLDEFYDDVQQSHYAYGAIRNLMKLGIFDISASNKFSGSTKIDRYSFYSYMAAFLEWIEGKMLPLAPPDSIYSDVYADHFSFPYIQKLVGAGLLDGKGELDGDKLIIRYEMAVFVSRILDYYQPSGEASAEIEEKTEEKVSSGYKDVLADHYASEAIAELVGTNILLPGEGRMFYGYSLINRYFLVDLTSNIIEKIVVGEEGELELANSARGYKDISASNFAYRSIQKLIGAGVIPPGDRKELFHGDRRITRYQMAFFVFSAIERVFADAVVFKAAHSSFGYGDVPEDYYVYKTIQKLIWLGVLEGGQDREFHGEEYVDRYELCFFMVNLMKTLYLKLGELEEVALKMPVGYGFGTYLSSSVTASQTLTNEAFGTATNSLYASQSMILSINRALNRDVFAYASLYTNYYFGGGTTYPYLYESYILVNKAPFVHQLGRTSLYQGYTPFGYSLFVDSAASSSMLDTVFVNYDHHLFNLNTGIGKLAYVGDITTDSNFGTLSISPKFPDLLSWLDVSLGTSLITDIPDPDYTTTLSSRVGQGYGGLKISFLSNFEFTAETARLSFSDQSVLSTVGYSSKEGFDASQYSLTYYLDNFDFNFSIGYQMLGDDYYLSLLANPAAFTGVEQGTESWHGKIKYSPSSSVYSWYIDLTSVLRDGENINNTIYGYYSYKLFDAAYLSLSVSDFMDNTVADQDSISLSSSLSLSF